MLSLQCSEVKQCKEYMNMTIGMTLDCVDIVVAAQFWKVALGFDEPLPPSDSAQFHALVSPGSGLHHLTLQRVDESKLVKNRAHLDLFVDDLDSEIARLSGIGATTLAVHDDEGGYRTAVMADPLGNEFCVVQRPVRRQDPLAVPVNLHSVS